MECGVSEEKLFSILKLNLAYLKNADDRIPFEQYLSLGRMAPELTNTPEIGFRL